MSSRLAETLPPVHGGQLRAIAAQFSVPEHKLLDFSASIYSGGPSPRVLCALFDAIRNPECIRAYPDLESLELRERLASYVNVPAGNVLVANGMVPLLSATLRAIGVRKCMLPVPAFGEYSRALHRDGVIIETSRLTEEANFRPDITELLACCARRGCDTLILTNPHNPTGAILQRADLQVLVRNAETCGIRILLDEAFIDFVPEESVSARVQSSNLFVFRSVTKFFGMAGVRVAYMIAPQQFVSAIAGQLDLWAISALASIATMAAVSDAPYIATTIACTQCVREMLSAELAALGLTVYPSRANFVFLRLGEARRNRNIWEQLILKHGIVIRNCSTFEGLDEGYFRIAVRSGEDNRRLLKALYAELNDVAQIWREIQCI